MTESQINGPTVKADAAATDDTLVFNGEPLNENHAQKGVSFATDIENEEGKDKDQTVLDKEATTADGAAKKDGENSQNEDGEESEEEVEEEYEEEVEDLDAVVDADEERPKKTVTKLRKVKRKKKKAAEIEEKAEEAAQADVAVQMPPWTEALEADYMSQDQLARVIKQLKEDGLDENDIRLGEDLHYRRSIFKVDQFVKMCEVREIVQKALHSILDKMKKAEETGRQNRTVLITLDSKTKTLQQQVSHLKRLENGQSSLIRMQKDQELKLADVNNKVEDWRYEAQVKQTEREQFDSETIRELNRVKGMTQSMEQQCQTLETMQQSMNEQFIEFTDNQKSLMDIEIATLKGRFEEMPAFMNQKIIEINGMSEDIKIKMDGQFEQILENLQVDDQKLVRIETNLKKLEEHEKKLVVLDTDVTKLKKLEDGVFQTQCFLERTLPMFVHHQVCEGLNVIAGPNLGELQSFEKKKTDEVYEHWKMCEGKKPSLRKLRLATEKFTENAWKFKIGSAPFTYGENKDFWPDMKKFADYDKRNYSTTRHLRIEQKIKDMDSARRAQMEEHLEYLFMVERDTTKALIHVEMKNLKASKPSKSGAAASRMMRQAASNQRANLNNNQQQQQRKDDEKKASPRFDNSSNDYNSNTVKRIPDNFVSPNRKPSTDSVGRYTKTTTAAIEQANMLVQQSAAQAFANPIQFVDKMHVGENQDDTENREKEHDISHEHLNQSMMDISQSGFDGQGSKIIQDVKIINSLQLIRKVDRLQLAFLKKKQKNFMSQGRSEFAYQLERWREIFDETQEDQCEMQTKVEDLEEMVNLLSQQLADVQGTLQNANIVMEEVQEENAEDFFSDDQQKGSSRETMSDQISELSRFKEKEEGIQRRGTTREGCIAKRSSSFAKKQLGSRPRANSMILKTQRINSLQEKPVNLDSQLSAIKEQVDEIQNESDKSSLDISVDQQTEAGGAALSSTSSHVQYSMTSKGTSVGGKSKQLKSFKPLKSGNEQTNTQAAAQTSQDTAKSVSFQKQKTSKVSQINVAASSKPPVEVANQITSPTRKSRLSKLENTQQRLQVQATGTSQGNSSLQPGLQRKATLGRAVSFKSNTMSPTSSIGTSSLEESHSEVSSMNTLEKKGNVKYSKKQAGNSFFFARQFNRETMSRTAMTSYVGEIFNHLTKKTDEYQLIANDRYENIVREKEHFKEQTLWFQENISKEQLEFSTKLEENMKKKGLEMQEILLDRINLNESHVSDFEGRLSKNQQALATMTSQIAQEYQDFCNNRKRWKSDFAMATEKAVQNLNTIRDLISGCEQQNQVNTRAVKFILDAQMIEQLVQRQDVADRQQLLGLAFKTDRDLMSTDLGTHGTQITGPKLNVKNLKHDQTVPQTTKRSTKGGVDAEQRQKVSTIKNTEDQLTSRIDTATAIKETITDASILKEFENNASKIDPPVLRIDRNCMNCADNKANTLNAIKVACLVHTQSAIPYQGKDYHVSDLLSVKARVVAQCQRMLRENLFQTKEHSGIDIRDEDNEKSYVIEPLNNTNAIKVDTKLQDLFKQNLLQSKRGASDNSPMLRQSQQQSQDSIHAHDNFPSKYQGNASPLKYGEDSVNFGVSGEQLLQSHDRDDCDYVTHHIVSQQRDVNGHKDDLFSSNAQLTPQNINITQRIQRGATQLAQHKDLGGAMGRTGMNQIRFSSQGKIKNLPHEDPTPRRFDQIGYVDVGGAHFPDVAPQQANFGNKKSNLDFDHIFESSQHVSSTKHSQIRQSSVFTGGTSVQRNNPLNRTGMNSSRYTGGARLGRSVVIDNSTMHQPKGSMMEENYRATDGFRNMHMKQLAQKKHIELINGIVSRPQTQENNAMGGQAGKRGVPNAFKSVAGGSTQK